MKNRLLAGICSLLFISMPLSALAAVDLGKLGIEIVEKTPQGDNILYRAKDKEGNSFSFSIKDEVTEAQAEILGTIKDTVFSWKYIDVSSLKILFSQDRADIAIIPTNFTYKDFDLNEFMPSGMQFYYTTFLEYDFRMRIDNLFLRMQGEFFTEDQFSEKLLVAVADPSLYMQNQDPDFVIKKTAIIEEKVEKVRFESGENSKNLNALETDYLALKEDYGALKEDYGALRNNYFILRGNYQGLEGEYDEHEGDYGSLKDDHGNLKVDYGDLRGDYGVIKGDFLAVKEDYGATKEDYLIDLLRNKVKKSRFPQRE